LGEEVDSLIVKGEREVTREVENTLGINGELFTSAVHIRQGEIDKLLSSDPATRKRHIGKLIGTEDMENAHKNFLEIIRGFDARAQALSIVPDELEEKKMLAKKETEEISHLRSKLSEIEKKIKKKREEFQRVEERISRLEDILDRTGEIEKLSLELSYIQREIERISNYETQLSENEEKSHGTEEVTEEIGRLKKEIASYDVVKDRLDRYDTELMNVREKREALEKELEKTFAAASSLLSIQVERGDQLEEGAEKSLKDLKAGLEETRVKSEETVRAVGEKNGALNSIKKAMSELDEATGNCPVCGKKLTQSHKDKLYSSYKIQLGTLSKEVETLSMEIKVKKKLAEALESKMKAISNLGLEGVVEREQRLNDVAKRIFELEADVKNGRASLEKLPALLEKLKDAEDELSGLTPYRERYIEALGFLRKNLSNKKGLETKGKELTEEISKRTRALESVIKSIEMDPTSLPRVIERDRREIKAIQEALSAFERDTAANVSSIKWKEKRLDELGKEIEKKEDQAREQRMLLKFKQLLEKIRAVFHKDALQKQLRLMARPLIEDYARDIFLSFNLPYSDVTLTDDFSLMVHGEGGEESLDMLSGGERIAAALALRIGLSKALSGPVMELIILDEPTIHLDAHRRRELVEVIRRLATIPQTIVVTHDKEFEESADRIIEVEKVDGVSVVK
jgi:exonuclease SbcC